MTADPIEEAIRQAKDEKNLRSIAHLWRQGLLSEETWTRLIDGLSINGGRKPLDSTGVKQAFRQAYYDEVGARARADNKHSAKHRERIARETWEARYQKFPDGSDFVWTSALRIAMKGPDKVRKGIP